MIFRQNNTGIPYSIMSLTEASIMSGMTYRITSYITFRFSDTYFIISNKSWYKFHHITKLRD